jgi:hypothetical protein
MRFSEIFRTYVSWTRLVGNIWSILITPVFFRGFNVDTVDIQNNEFSGSIGSEVGGLESLGTSVIEFLLTSLIS